MLQVIKEITQGMGEGMADFIESEVLTVEDYDLYCHYVAGLVGIGLLKVRFTILILASTPAFRATCNASVPVY